MEERGGRWGYMWYAFSPASEYPPTVQNIGRLGTCPYPSLVTVMYLGRYLEPTACYVAAAAAARPDDSE